MRAIRFRKEDKATPWFDALNSSGLIQYSRPWAGAAEYTIAPFAYRFLKRPFARWIHRLGEEVARS
jgi:hypothetical protein